jgi:hypothetical protein
MVTLLERSGRRVACPWPRNPPDCGRVGHPELGEGHSLRLPHVGGILVIISFANLKQNQDSESNWESLAF